MVRQSTFMSPKRRFLAALFGGRTDRVPVGNPTSIATVELMERAGVYYPDADLDPEKMATLAAAGHEVVGFDTVTPVCSTQQEAAALGCEVEWGDREHKPTNITSPFDEPEKITIPRDFLDRPSTSVVLEAIRLLRGQYGDHVAIIGKVVGPWTLSYRLYGEERFLDDAAHSPDRAWRFLQAVKGVPVLFGRAQLQAGADALMLVDHASSDLVSAEQYRDFLVPLYQEITAATGGPTICHLCGDTTDRLGYISQAGFDGFHFASEVDPSAAIKGMAGRVSLIGNVNIPNTLMLGTPEQVKEEVWRLLEAGIQIIAPECSLPRSTPLSNLIAIVEGVEQYHQENGRSRTTS